MSSKRRLAPNFRGRINPLDVRNPEINAPILKPTPVSTQILDQPNPDIGVPILQPTQASRYINSCVNWITSFVPKKTDQEGSKRQS